MRPEEGFKRSRRAETWKTHDGFEMNAMRGGDELPPARIAPRLQWTERAT
jgi:hypothetical protein